MYLIQVGVHYNKVIEAGLDWVQYVVQNALPDEVSERGLEYWEKYWLLLDSPNWDLLLKHLELKQVKCLTGPSPDNAVLQHYATRRETERPIEHRHVLTDPLVQQVRRVKVLYSACTEALQTKLNQGWHILAVCPSDTNRRPDYILGRIDSNGDDVVADNTGEKR